jgi:hypothetical protein
MPDARNNPHMSNKLSTSWETVNVKPRKSHKVEAIIQDQLLIPVIPITNRCCALHNLKNITEFLRHIQFQCNKKNTFTRQNKITDSPKKRKKRILLLGDSHMHGCASKLGEYLGSTYEITGTIMPGSRLQHVMKLARDETAGLSHKDAVIIWGGSNDVNRNETSNGLNHLN